MDVACDGPSGQLPTEEGGLPLGSIVVLCLVSAPLPAGVIIEDSRVGAVEFDGRVVEACKMRMGNAVEGEVEVLSRLAAVTATGVAGNPRGGRVTKIPPSSAISFSAGIKSRSKSVVSGTEFNGQRER